MNKRKNRLVATGPKSRNRRRWLMLGAAAVPLLAVGGVSIHRYDVAKREMHDLSPIGGGLPVVVQVHDPSCSLCRTLMRSTKTVLEDRTDILYRIADLTTVDGASFGVEHSVGKVTLLLFDKRGRLVETIKGVTPPEELEARFAARFGAPEPA